MTCIKTAHTPVEWHEPLFDHAKRTRITKFSTPFYRTGIDLSEGLHTSAYKITSPKITYLTIGKPNYLPTKIEKAMLIAGRSLYLIANVKTGDSFTSENIKSIRPNFGLRPKFYKSILETSATKDIARGQPLTFSMASGLQD